MKSLLIVALIIIGSTSAVLADGAKIFLKDGSSSVKISIGKEYDPKSSHNAQELYHRVRNLEAAVESLQYLVYNTDINETNKKVYDASMKCYFTGTYKCGNGNGGYNESGIITKENFGNVTLYASAHSKGDAIYWLEEKRKSAITQATSEIISLCTTPKYYSHLVNIKTFCSDPKIEIN